MEYIEKHIEKIRELLKTNDGLYYRLEKVAEYLLETYNFSALSIFRRTGDELDDHIFATNRKSPTRKTGKPETTFILSADMSKKVSIVPSKHVKARVARKNYVSSPEFIIPITRLDDVVGFIHAEKNVGSYFSPAEIKLLKEAAKVISRQFVPTVLSLD